MMTPSKKAKSLGLKSIKQVSEITGVSVQTLYNWSKQKPRLFYAVLVGCKKIQMESFSLITDFQKRDAHTS